MEEDKPIAKYQAGAIRCALWPNRVTVDGRATIILKATIDRRYQDRNGVWQTSQSFSRNDIPLVIHVLQKAFAAMLERTADQEIRDAIDEVSDRLGRTSLPEEKKVRI